MFRRFWRCASSEPCEKLSRQTSAPASNRRSSVSTSPHAGPMVATILVRIMRRGLYRKRGRLSRGRARGVFENRRWGGGDRCAYTSGPVPRTTMNTAAQAAGKPTDPSKRDELRASTDFAAPAGRANSSRAFYLACAAIFALAMTLRLIHLYQIRTIPLFEHLIGDADSYDQWAR